MSFWQKFNYYLVIKLTGDKHVDIVSEYFYIIFLDLGTFHSEQLYCFSSKGGVKSLVAAKSIRYQPVIRLFIDRLVDRKIDRYIDR